MQFQDKTVWITGASSGIGRELALQLSAMGAKLVLSSRRMEALESVRQACVHPERHKCLVLDLADSDGLAACALQAWDNSGGIDILFNNGGISQRSLALETSLVVDRQIMEVDYFGTVALTKGLVPLMIDRGEGHVVTISSIAGKLGSPLRSAYCAAKHAIIGFMDCLRAEIADTGVQVHVVCPGYVQTDVAHNALTSGGEAFDEVDADIATGMPVEDFVVQLLRALAKDEAEIVIAGGKLRLAYALRRMAPNTFHRLLPRIASKQGG